MVRKQQKSELKEHFATRELEHLKSQFLKSNHKEVHLFHKFADSVALNIVENAKVPHIKNVLSFVFSEKPFDVKKSKELFVRKCNIAQLMIAQTDEKVIDNIANKIKSGACVLTHGNTPALIPALAKAKMEGKNFKVLITDSPFSELGKFYYSQLRKNHITTEFYPSASVKSALNKSDIVFVGAEAVTPSSFIGEVGTELIAELAFKEGIPVYAVSSSWNFHKEIETKELKHIAKQKLKGSHSFFDESFEKINPSFFSGIISEKGTHNHSVFVDIVMKDRKIF